MIEGKVNHKEYKRQHNRKYRLRATWWNMKNRCSNPKCKGYRNYGGRGIGVCNGWENSYIHFERWALQNGYRHNLQIDRIDVNSNYTPENCRFVTLRERARNRRPSRKNVILTFQGKTQCLSAWAREFGMSRQTLHFRLRHSNWSIESALTAPLGTGRTGRPRLILGTI